jgi:predicted amidohydrolase YtcJ
MNSAIVLDILRAVLPGVINGVADAVGAPRGLAREEAIRALEELLEEPPPVRRHDADEMRRAFEAARTNVDEP